MAKPEDPPAGWASRPWPLSDYTWPEFLAEIASTGGSSAGMTSMQESVDKIREEIHNLSLIFGTDIDVVAHSQAAAIARAAIRELAEDPTRDNPVHTMISLGGQNYGASSFAPEFELDFIGGSLISAVYMAGCRDNQWFDVCPDIIRFLSLQQPDSNNPDPGLHKTSFFPDLNAPGPAGPVPQDTQFVHLYSSIFDATDGEEEQAGENVELFSNQPNTTNLSVQEFCEPFRTEPYALHHNAEWVDDAMRVMVGFVLGFGATPGPADACGDTP